MEEQKQDLTGEFIRRYKELDALCKQKFNIPEYKEDGSWDARSGVVAYANILSGLQSKRLRKMWEVRNNLSHETDFDVVIRPGAIRLLDEYIARIKSELSSVEPAKGQNAAEAVNAQNKGGVIEAKQVAPAAAATPGPRATTSAPPVQPYYKKNKPVRSPMVEAYIKSQLPHFDRRIGELNTKLAELPEESRKAILDKAENNYLKAFRETGSIEHASSVLAGFDKFVNAQLQSVAGTKKDEEKSPVKPVDEIIPEEKYSGTATLELSFALPYAYASADNSEEEDESDDYDYASADNSEEAAELHQYVTSRKEKINNNIRSLVEALQEANVDGSEIEAVKEKAYGYLGRLEAAATKDAAIRVYTNFRNYQKNCLNKYTAAAAPANSAPANSTPANYYGGGYSYKSSSFPWGWIIGAVVGLIVVAGIVCLIVFGKYINWNGWQHVIGSLGGLVLSGLAFLIAVDIIDDECPEFLIYLAFAIVNCLLFAFLYEKYKIIFIWISAYEVIWGGALAFKSLDDCEDMWCVADIAATLAILASVITLGICGNNLSWAGWQHSLGVIIGLFLSFAFIFITFVFDVYELKEGLLAKLLIPAIAAVINFVLFLILRGNYRIMFIWLSAFEILWCLGLTFYHFEEGYDAGDGVFQLIEGAVIAACLTLGLIFL